MNLLRIIYILFLFSTTSSFSQSWPKVFGTATNSWCNDLAETYDKGYLIIGQVDQGISVPRQYSWLIKTNINGIKLWDKKIVSNQYGIISYGADKTLDGGLVLAGFTTKLDPQNNDIFFIKYNSCGEKEWCNIVSTPGNDDYALKIKQIIGGYIALVDYFQDWVTKRIWLFKMDISGDIVWEKLINESNANLINAEGRDLLVNQNGDCFITGDVDDGSPGHPYWTRPFIIKTDSGGSEQWQDVYGHSWGFKGDVAMCPTENQSGFIYTSARHSRDSVSYGDSPCFLKITPAGQEVYYRDILPTTSLGMATTLNIISPSQMILGCSYTYSPSGNNGKTSLIKCDTLGNVIKTKVLVEPVYNTLASSHITFDNKCIASGGFSTDTVGFHSKIYLFKTNFDLEYDSIYTVPRTYDSLCPHPIVSDTTSLDDCVITGIEDPALHPEKMKLVVYPNPASKTIHIEMPHYISYQNKGIWFTTTTIYHQWNSTTLEIYDLFGRLMFSKEIPKRMEKIEFDISSWHPGMYVARLVFMNEVVANAKFLIQ